MPTLSEISINTLSGSDIDPRNVSCKKGTLPLNNGLVYLTNWLTIKRQQKMREWDTGELSFNKETIERHTLKGNSS